MPRNNRNKKGNKGSSKKVHSPSQDVATPAVATPAVATPAAVVPAPAAQVVDEVSPKGRIRQAIESKHVENAVSYLSGYAPTLANLYGSMKEQLPETLKTRVDSLETDYVVPTAKKSIDVANNIVDKVDDHLTKAEEVVAQNIDATRNTVMLTKETVVSNVESTKQIVLSNVLATVGTGLDKIEGAVDYILPEKSTEEEGTDAIEPKESEQEIQARVRQLSAKLVKRLEKLSLVAAIHKATADSAKAMNERYEQFQETVVVPSQNFLNENYAKSGEYLKETRSKSESFLIEKFEKSGIQELSTTTYKKLNDTVISPTSAFVEGFKLELKGNKAFENLPKTKDELISALVQGYGLVQSKVLLPAAKYVGVGETFKVYEEFLINKVFGGGKSVTVPASQESSSQESFESEGPEVWHDAPAKFENDKLVPLYPDDDEE